MQVPNGSRGTRLAGKVAIVTGAGFDGEFLGTGAAIAILLASQGARVGLVDLSAERAEQTRSCIADVGGDASVALADVSVADQCQRAVDQIVATYGRLDILINNAGIAAGGSVVEIDEDLWDHVVDVNLKSVMLMSRFSIPRLRDAGGGSVVNISSIAAMRGFGTAPYAASKGGVIALTADMAYTHGREGIRVNCIAPGHLFTPMGYRGDDELRDARRQAGLLGTEGDAWDVAWAALFLASDESRWITGVLLPVDAGATATAALAMRGFLAEARAGASGGAPA
jgi:NAD(P)-dependent dehydrogenase (short-subunit alcohol dehydrogenase family)